jgi:hypothetical protein
MRENPVTKKEYFFTGLELARRRDVREKMGVFRGDT